MDAADTAKREEVKKKMKGRGQLSEVGDPSPGSLCKEQSEKKQNDNNHLTRV